MWRVRRVGGKQTRMRCGPHSSHTTTCCAARLRHTRVSCSVTRAMVWSLRFPRRGRLSRGDRGPAGVGVACADGDPSADSDFLERDRKREHPVSQWPPSPRRCGTIMASAPSSRRPTTPCFVCIERDGIVSNFSARQHVVRHRRGRARSLRAVAGRKPARTRRGRCGCGRPIGRG
jgi:hypothetical protein